ncbi:MAG: 50S ribosomal protein L24 [Oscillospiraceae bacterium]|jgi:large subunit ribosomal protein L24|nr:50S ribosomal protein L24 [Oscillospiraceae bacterium]
MVNKLHVKKDDTVVVIAGEGAGKQGKIIRALPKSNRVIVEGVALVTKHQKPRGQGMPGGKFTKEAPIAVSNVLLVCPQCGKATRNAHTVSEDGSRARLCKKCGAVIDS